MTSIYKVIPPGATQTLREITRKDIGPPVLQFRAAIFEDGTTYGDPEWVQVFLQGRSVFLQALNSGLADLQKATADNMTRDALLQKLTASQNTLVSSVRFTPQTPPPTAGTPEALADRQFVLFADMACKRPARAVYQFLTGNITKFPVRSDGHVVTLADAEQQVTRYLDQQRDGVMHSLPAVASR
ncbi:MAG TPA: hypothetical protein VG675_24395 [Bryobacteraceae bacterium]|nr:hypothetical protein [Bryobacteraceae bacterium]